METKYFKTDKTIIKRTNNGGNGSEVGKMIIDNIWGGLRFVPTEGFDFDASDLIDLGMLMKKLDKK